MKEWQKERRGEKSDTYHAVSLSFFSTTSQERVARERRGDEEKQRRTERGCKESELHCTIYATFQSLLHIFSIV